MARGRFVYVAELYRPSCGAMQEFDAGKLDKLVPCRAGFCAALLTELAHRDLLWGASRRDALAGAAARLIVFAC